MNIMFKTKQWFERASSVQCVLKKENYSQKQWTGGDDLHFVWLIRSPSETYEGIPLDNEEKEKDRFIQIIRQVSKKNLVDFETLIMLTITFIL